MSEKIITENEYPISGIWLLKDTKTFTMLPAILVFIVGTIGAVVFTDEPGLQTDFWSVTIAGFVFFLVYLVIIGFEVGWNILRRKFFHYTIAKDYFELKSGVITRQERHIPYSKLQTVYVRQDLFDRIFGIKQVVIENAAGSGFLPGTVPSSSGIGFSAGVGVTGSLGSAGNTLVVPGLVPADAENLKLAILEKIISSTADDGGSGL